MATRESDTDELLRLTQAGDARARGDLLARHRGRLRRMVELRLDGRLAARVDPSDVVQEVLAEADRRLDDYLRRRPLPFHPWLRQIAADRLADARRRHLHAGRRSVQREQAGLDDLPEGSAMALAERLLDRGAGPSEALRREEQRHRVRRAIAALAAPDREVLTLRYLEELTAREVAEVLGVAEAAAKKRALRALQRLREILERESTGGGR